jgi:hypothetical protein
MPRGGGLFLLDALAVGAYDLTVDDGTSPPVARTVVVQSGARRERFVLQRAQVLRGRVLDEAGEPVSNALVSARCPARRSDGENDLSWFDDPELRTFREGRRVATDHLGNFELTGVNAATTSCVVQAEQPGGARGIYENARPGETIILKLRREMLTASREEAE